MGLFNSLVEAFIALSQTREIIRIPYVSKVGFVLFNSISVILLILLFLPLTSVFQHNVYIQNAILLLSTIVLALSTKVRYIVIDEEIVFVKLTSNFLLFLTLGLSMVFYVLEFMFFEIDPIYVIMSMILLVGAIISVEVIDEPKKNEEGIDDYNEPN